MKIFIAAAATFLVLLGGGVLLLAQREDARHHPVMRMLGFGCRCRPERPAFACLKTLAAAQADFHAHDRDGNGIQDFWRTDLAGLYTLKDNRLIELSIAAADAKAVSPIASFATPAPKAGYWFRAIRHEGETKPDPQRFAYCTYPDRYPDSGKKTFILSEMNEVWSKDLGHGNGVEAFPANPNLDGWSRVD